MRVPIKESSLFLTILFYGLSSGVRRGKKLSVVTDSRHIIYLYERLKNEDAPSAPDPALTDPKVRGKICNDITGSGFFHWDFLKPVRINQIFRTLQKPRYRNIFLQIYTRTNPEDEVQQLLNSNNYEYTNTYKRWQFSAINSTNHTTSTRTITTKEYAFICLMKDSRDNLVPYYVSKEYNLYGEGAYVAGRFLFRKPRMNAPPNHYQILLSEEPAVGLGNLHSDVEQYYLGLRTYRQPVDLRDEDPVCQLTSTDLSRNQTYRVCAEIYGSKYFKWEVKYPMPWFHHECIQRIISFQSTAARREARGKTYQEYMIPCETRLKGSSQRRIYYVSRAYRRHQVFVYKNIGVRGRSRFVLENRSINVHAVDELLGFDDVE